MEKFIAVALLALSVGGCASMQSDSGKGRATVAVADPDVEIRQISSVPTAAQHVEGGIPVQYELRVRNNAAHAITLKQITIQSMGYGGYDIGPVSRPFSLTVQPASIDAVQFWAPANVENASLVGANGPVTLRVTTKFDSPVGQFQRISVQQVNANADISGQNH
jgi:hypothetical protein